MSRARIIRFNQDDKSLSRKKKKVTLVKWFEPLREGENCNKFVVVFEDGTIYVFFKDSKQNSQSLFQKIKYTVEPF